MQDMKMFIVSGFLILMGVFSVLLGWLHLLGWSYGGNEILIAAAIGLIGAIIGGVASGVLTLSGVILTVRHSSEQMREQARLDDARERDLILRKINIEKFQETLKHLYEINKYYMKLFVNVRRYLAEEISHDRLKDDINELENLIIEQRRGLSACKSFIPEYENYIIAIINDEKVVTGLICDYYTYPDIGEKSEEYKDPLRSLEILNRKLVDKVVMETIRINDLIKNELNQLKTDY